MRVYGSPSGFDWTTTRLTDAELTDSSSFSVWLQSTVKRQLLRSDEASCCVATHSAWMSTNVHMLVSAHPEVQQDKTKQTHTHIRKRHHNIWSAISLETDSLKNSESSWSEASEQQCNNPFLSYWCIVKKNQIVFCSSEGSWLISFSELHCG